MHHKGRAKVVLPPRGAAKYHSKEPPLPSTTARNRKVPGHKAPLQGASAARSYRCKELPLYHCKVLQGTTVGAAKYHCKVPLWEPQGPTARSRKVPPRGAAKYRCKEPPPPSTTATSHRCQEPQWPTSRKPRTAAKFLNHCPKRQVCSQ